jgi:hypothetical protein
MVVLVCGASVMEQVKKSDLIDDEEALLELLSIRAVGFLPPIHEVMAEGLKQRGFVSRNTEGWQATTSGQLMLRWGTQVRTLQRSGVSIQDGSEVAKFVSGRTC